MKYGGYEYQISITFYFKNSQKYNFFYTKHKKNCELYFNPGMD